MPTNGIDDLVQPGAELEQVVTGGVFTEGPVWLWAEGALLFSDITADRLMRWSPDDGTSVVRTPNGKGNGMTLDNQGRLLVCEHATSTLTRTVDYRRPREVIASHVGGAELNSPNDVVVMRDGSILFTDPDFGRTLPTVGVVRDVPQRVCGVYRIAPGGGEPRLLVGDFAEPNGLCLSPDESVLYIGDTARAHVRAFEMPVGGGPLRDAGVFASGISRTTGGGDYDVDGLKVDELGNVYVTGPGGVWVFTPAGERLGMIEVPEQVANLNWGGERWTTLYLTARTSVYRLTMRVAGNALPYMVPSTGAPTEPARHDGPRSPAVRVEGEVDGRSR